MSTEALGNHLEIQDISYPDDAKGTWVIRNKHNHIILCQVEWFPRWKRYTSTYTNNNAHFDARMHRDIADFLDKLNAEYKVQKGLRQAAQTEPAVWGAPIPPEEG